ncbi:MAG: AAA family ATPase [Proteobacteria bacterium]|nr:AAA family ATPase [Pseudomonadota bacterium]
MSMTHSGALESKRFELRHVLGEGGMGVVYEAYDRRLETLVALKTLPVIDGGSLLRFKREFRSLAGIEHPNLVRLGELHCERGQWFYTMELIRGQSLLYHVRPGDQNADPTGSHGATSMAVTRTLRRVTHAESTTETDQVRPQQGQPGYDEATLRACFGQLASALHTLHTTHRVHRDVKSSNVLVEASGRTVLLDFGLIHQLDEHRENLLERGAILGSPLFMAPEQSQGGAVGPQADWYAFGVLLFWALVGQPPFAGPRHIVLHAKRTCKPPRPGSMLAAVPRDLDELCWSLLQQNPHERFTGSEVLARLSGGEATEVSNIAEDTSTADRHSVQFVGREDELATLQAILARAEHHSSGAIFVHGQPGIGKTALVQHFLDRAQSRDDSLIILRGRAYEQESVPLRGFDVVIDDLAQYLESLPMAQAAPLLRDGVPTLSQLFPVLRRVSAVSRQVLRDSPAANAGNRLARAFSELKSLLAAIARCGTLVVFVDDMQWVEDDSLDLLTHLLHPPIANCAFFATVRTTDDIRDQRLIDALGDDANNNLQHLVLAGLPEKHALNLVTSWWKGAHYLDPAMLVKLVNETHGHPLFLQQLGQWGRGSRDSEITQLHLSEVLWQRIEALDAPARRFLRMSALVGLPTPVPALAGAAELSVDAAQGVLARLRAGHFIRVSRRGEERLVEIYHDRIREVMNARSAVAGTREFCELHLRLGQALVQSTSEKKLDERVFAIVHHLNLGVEAMPGDTQRMHLAELNLRAAALTAVTTSYARSDDYLDKAEALLGDQPWAKAYRLARALSIQRMTVAYLSGDVRRGQAAFGELLHQLRSPAEKLEAYAVKARLELDRGKLDRAVACGIEGLRSSGMAVPDTITRADLIREFAVLRWHQGRRTIPDFVSLPRLRDPHLQAQMRLLTILLPAAFLSDGRLYALLILRVVGMSLRHGISRESISAFGSLGALFAGHLHQYYRAHALSEVAMQLNTRVTGGEFNSRFHLQRGAFIKPWIRPLAEAETELVAARQTGRMLGDITYGAYAGAHQIALAVCRGQELGLVQDQIEEISQDILCRQHPDVAAALEVFRQYCSALRGRLDDPRSPWDDPDAAISTISPQAVLAGYYYYVAGAEVNYLLGDYERAWVLSRSADSLRQAAFSSIFTAQHVLIDALIAAKRASLCRGSQRRQLRRSLRASLATLRKHAMSCPETYQSFYVLVSGENARLSGDLERAESLYQVAADAASHQKAHQREAIAHMLTADLLRTLNQPKEAEQIHKRARTAFRQWGAFALASTDLPP